jgi:hypothetical protein
MMAGLSQRLTNMFSVVLRKAEQVRRYAITNRQSGGWQVTFELEGKTRQVHYNDWHRVERALAMVKLEVNELIAHGWRPTASPPRA